MSEPIPWEAVGAVAELLGAIGVIGSLIYLAKQINANSENIAQNTKALVSDRDIDSNQNVKDIASSIYQNPELATIVYKGHRGESLDGVASLRYGVFVSTLFESHQTFFIQHIKGTVSDELWKFYSDSYSHQMRSPGMRDWWTRNRDRFNPEFAAYIDKKILEDA